MDAIITKYHGPTYTRGTRISARCGAARIIRPRRYNLDENDNHRAVAQELADQLGMTGRLIMASLRDGHVFIAIAGQTS